MEWEEDKVIKPGVNVRGIQPEILLARIIVGEIFTRYGYPAIITSGSDGKHKAGSKHYEGQAIDLRIKHMDERLWPVVAEALSKALGPQYDVILEAKKLHIHVEFDPK